MGNFSAWATSLKASVTGWWRRMIGGAERHDVPPVRPDDSRPSGSHAPRSRVAPPPPPIPPEIAKILDPYLGMIWALIESGDWQQLKARTGIDQQSGVNQSLPLFIELGTPELGNDTLRAALMRFNLDVPAFYYNERIANKALTKVTARIALRAGDPGQVAVREGPAISLTNQLLEIFKSPLVRRISVGRTHQPCLEDSLRDIGLVPYRGHNGHALDGSGVVVGIIDYGCAFAHRHFLRRVSLFMGTYLTARVHHLWDQANAPTIEDAAAGWTGTSVPYGRELAQPAINAAIAARISSNRQIREEDVYKYLNFDPGIRGDLSSHGTHVMDIAAGNGQTAIGSAGVATNSDIIFVQLPAPDIETPGAALDTHIIDGLAYIFARAGSRPVVVNISFGGYSGPHDGTSDWESQIDQMLTVSNRAVVVSAGNGFEAECHASGAVQPGVPRTLGWLVKGLDPTQNDLEIWYDGRSRLEFSLIEPDTGHVYGPYGLGTRIDLERPDGLIFGGVGHSIPGTNGDVSVVIALRPTSDDALTTTHAPTRAGLWQVKLSHVQGPAASFDGWIQRDDIGRYGGRRQQSRFVETDVDPKGTIGDFATGHSTIAVGAYNACTQAIERYSACGPTRTGSQVPGRPKPDIYAPATEDAAGRGILCASSQRGITTRMGGTSAAAPHVTGLVALILEYSTKFGTKMLSADEIRQNLASTGVVPLNANRHQIVDTQVPIKQTNVWAHLIGKGKVDFRATLKNLFP